MQYMPLVLASVLTFAITTMSGVWAIPFLKRLKFGQNINKLGPKWHEAKSGTPTMGGIMMMVGSVVGIAFGLTLLLNKENHLPTVSRLISGFVFACGLGFIGFVDDYLKIIRKQNEGLTERQKTIMQLLVISVYLWAVAMSGDNTRFWVPFKGDVELGLFYYPISLLVIYATVNAVNFTDGIDGLCVSVTGLVALGFMIISVITGSEFIVLAGVLLGACAGFMIWNWNPAKVFMGDTGSLFLGGLVVAIAFGLNKQFLIAIFGVVYVWEIASVLIQRFYYKVTKKRLFKMTPIHHSFEISGYSEKRIVLIFSVITVLGVALGVALVLNDYII